MFKDSIKILLQKLISLLLTRLNNRDIRKILLTSLEKRENNFRTEHQRPQMASRVKTWSDHMVVDYKIGVVVQGPIIKDNEFTLNTLKIYKQHFKNSIILLSTWMDVETEYIKNIKDLGIIVILNNKPNNPGIQNINLQIVSTFNGIKKLKEMGVHYILKTRTDQRIYAPNVESYLVGILEAFPPSNNYKLEKRIIGLSLNTFKYRLYGVSDMFIFGTIQDMMVYWGCRLDKRKSQTEYSNINVYEESKRRLCEVYLSTNFLNEIGYKIHWSLSDSFKVFSEIFCIIDKESVDLFWSKYSNSEFRYLKYDGIRTNNELVFRDWLRLYISINNFSINEKALSFSSGAIIKSCL